jgi:microcystin-dependent protein
MALIAGVQYSGTAAGTILPCGKGSALPMTLLCDGTSYTTAAYPALFAAIGYSFGGSGANFNVPDFRGRFLRGVDGSASNDPDKASRTAMNTGGNTGNLIGSVQGDDFKTHTHDLAVAGTTNAAASNARTELGSGLRTTTGPTNIVTGNETRPKNAYVNYCIAY